jgi:hypothetical protein
MGLGFLIDADGLITYDRNTTQGTRRGRCSY